MRRVKYGDRQWEERKWHWQRQAERHRTKYLKMARVCRRMRFLDMESLYPFVYVGGADLEAAAQGFFRQLWHHDLVVFDTSSAGDR